MPARIFIFIYYFFVEQSSFPGTRFSFKVYYPASDEVEDSEISDDVQLSGERAGQQ